LYREEELSSGDLLMVGKNNYFWAANCKEMDFIANGEIIEVRKVRRTYEEYGFRFADIIARFQDYDLEMDMKILLDTLQNEAPALTKEQNDRLFYTVLQDYEDITTKAGKIKKMKEDPHYNVLQVKYAYAVTCHKAQGGQWKNVFLDIGYITEDMLGEDFYRWLYTAMTRSSERLYLVNLPDEFEE
jgi:exodeoxyribonuclease-5